MTPQRINIDFAVVTRRTAQERQAAEDLDEALLRACKALYGDQGVSVFEVVHRAVQARATQDGVPFDEALQRMGSSDPPCPSSVA